MTASAQPHRPTAAERRIAKEDDQYLEDHADGLSRSTLHARWIHTLHDKPERDGQTLATRNVEVIQAWAAARDARPATTAGGDAEHPRVLRLDFGEESKGLQAIEWEAWQRVFEERQLTFLYQETKKDGDQSNFFRLDSPEREDG